MTKRLKGSQLSQSEQQKALSQFVHRYTVDNLPEWAKGLATPHFASDADWLENTLFCVTKTGKIDQRVKHCESKPSWPQNPELRKG